MSLNNRHLSLYTIYIGSGRTSPTPNQLLNIPTISITPTGSISNQSSEEDENEIDSITGELPKRVSNSLYDIYDIRIYY